GQLTTKRLGPEVMTRCGLNRLDSNPQLLAGLSDTAFYDEIRSEPLSHITDIARDPFELERRRPCDHVELRYVRQRVDDLLAHAITEIVLFRLWAHIHEWQHRDGSLVLGLHVLPRFEFRLCTRPA